MSIIPPVELARELKKRKKFDPTSMARPSAVAWSGELEFCASFGSRQDKELDAPDCRKHEGGKSPLDKARVTVENAKNRDQEPCVGRQKNYGRTAHRNGRS